MTTLTYFANSGAYLVGGIGLGYLLHDVRTALKKTRNTVEVMIVSEEDIKELLKRINDETE